MMQNMNWEIILSNISEAREQLEQIAELAMGRKKPSEIKFQLMLEHAYHHLNFAWHIRHVSTKRYSKLSDDEFNEWSKFPLREITASTIQQKRQNGARKRYARKSE